MTILHDSPRVLTRGECRIDGCERPRIGDLDSLTSRAIASRETLMTAKDERRRAAANSPAPGRTRLAKDETT